MADSKLTVAVDEAYSLNALLIACFSALEAMENQSDARDIARVTGAVTRVLRDVAGPMVGACIDTLEQAESAEAASAE